MSVVDCGAALPRCMDFHPLLPCQALGQALVHCHQRRGDFVGCVGLVVCPAPPLWIADQVRNDGAWRLVLACWHPHLTLWIPAYAGMTVRDAGNDGAGGCFGLFHPHL